MGDPFGKNDAAEAASENLTDIAEAQLDLQERIFNEIYMPMATGVQQQYDIASGYWIDAMENVYGPLFEASTSAPYMTPQEQGAVGGINRYSDVGGTPKTAPPPRAATPSPQQGDGERKLIQVGSYPTLPGTPVLPPAGWPWPDVPQGYPQGYGGNDLVQRPIPETPTVGPPATPVSPNAKYAPSAIVTPDLARFGATPGVSQSAQAQRTEQDKRAEYASMSELTYGPTAETRGFARRGDYWRAVDPVIQAGYAALPGYGQMVSGSGAQATSAAQGAYNVAPQGDPFWDTVFGIGASAAGG